MENKQYVIAQEEHDYNKKYEEGTIVKHTINGVTTAYTAKKNVPQFISILNENYWKKIASTASSGGGGVDIFDEDVEATDAQRNKALANVSNQTANSSTGKMGYKVLDSTKTFASQVTAENTIYEIRDVFDLNNGSVTIPAGCTLKFEGGKIINGSVSGTNTAINNISNACIFDSNVEILGSWNISKMYSTWFNFISTDDGTTDNMDCFLQMQGIINGSTSIDVEFKKGYYQIKPKDKSINGVYKLVFNWGVLECHTAIVFENVSNLNINFNGSTIKELYHLNPHTHLFNFVGVQNAFISNCNIEGRALNFDYPVYTYILKNETTAQSSNYEVTSAFRQVGGNLTIQNINISYMTGDCVCAGSATYEGINYSGESSIISNCEMSYCGRNAISLMSCKNIIVQNTNIHHIGSETAGTIGSYGIKGFNPRSGIDIEFEDGQHINSNIIFDNLHITDCARRAISENISITNEYIDSWIISNSEINGEFVAYSDNLKINDCTIKLQTPIAGTETGILLNTNGIISNCKIIIGQNSQLAVTGNKFIKCDIKSEQSSSNYVFTSYYFDDNSKISSFENCKLSLHYAEINHMSFKNCLINLLQKTSYNLADTEFNNCIINSELFLSDETNPNSEKVSARFTRVRSSGDCIFDNCKLSNIKGLIPYVSNNNESYGIYRSTGSGNCNFINCIFTNTNLMVYQSNFLFDSCFFKNDVHIANNGNTGNINIDNSIGVIEYLYMGAKVRNSKLEIKAVLTYSGSTYAKYYNSYIISDLDLNYNNCIIEKSNGKIIFNIGAKTSTENRPVLTANKDIGSICYDTDLSKYICWNGTAWVNLDGTALS